jgi:hypothetical protein
MDASGIAGLGHEPAAAIAAESVSPTPTPRGICAIARTTNPGAAALKSDAPASTVSEANSVACRSCCLLPRASHSAATAALNPDTVRSCPTVETEAPRSLATSDRIGDNVTSEPWLAKRARKSGTLRRVVSRRGERRVRTDHIHLRFSLRHLHRCRDSGKFPSPGGRRLGRSRRCACTHISWSRRSERQ